MRGGAMKEDAKDPAQSYANNPKDALSEELRRTSLRAAADLLEFTHRIKELGDQLDGTIFAGGEGSGMSKEERPRAGELVYEAVRLQLDVANHLLTLGQKQANLWIDRARRFGAVALPPERRAPLHLETHAKNRAAEWEPIHVH